MERITDFKSVETLNENQILGKLDNASLKNSNITFNGKGNVVYVESGVNIANSRIVFNGDNSLLYLSKNWYEYYIDFRINNNTTVFIGKNNYFNNALNVITSEGQNVFFGEDCLISMNVFLRTADPHLIYDIETKKRVNASKSILIGDHVWLGQNAMILKGTVIGSGSVVGAGSVVTGKRIISNCIYAGNPAKKIKSGIFYENDCVHQWTPTQTAESEICELDKHIYKETDQTIDLTELDMKLKEADSAQDKIEVLKKYPLWSNIKNRFAVCEEAKRKKFGFLNK